MSPASETQPLLASDRPSSQRSNERADAEDEAILASQSKLTHTPRNKYGFWRELGLFVWAIVATAAVIVLAVYAQQQRRPASGDGSRSKPSGKRNLIFMVSDGMGPASLSLTRSFRQHIQGLPIDDILNLDQHLIGSSRTRSSNSLVTDSAAGATAFSCGKKSYNGAIAVLPDHTACGTVLEAAKRAGYMTGLVVTTDITDATPACFSSHVNLRIQDDAIALQQVGDGPLGRVVDLMLGGGRCHFLPNGTAGGCRQDDVDVTQIAQEKYGWSYIDDRAGFDGLLDGTEARLPLLGLFAPTDIPFEIDRQTMEETYPSLDEMARTALTALDIASKDNDKGFFLMIEGSRIDHGGHFNDPAAQVHEVLAYDKAFASVLAYLEGSDAEGAVIATSDHETGGLAVARQLTPSYPQYKWLPEILAHATHSSEYLTKQLYNHIRASDSIAPLDLKDFISKQVEEGLGVYDATDTEIQAVVDNLGSALYVFSDMISRRAQIGWSTHGHSAVDVNIYGSAGASQLRGNHENTEIGDFLREYLEVDVEAITKELNEKTKLFSNADISSWMGSPMTDEELRQLPDHHYDHLGTLVI
ncbi:MAG: hypothetical protein M1818_006819 [Claussenomyces sp. TS43310]|nr:MAG: hypothetical protein M1818_006819 [Claussenomyces sp. TS43310]